jgi:serine/threonine protein phosphatase PrpC
MKKITVVLLSIMILAMVLSGCGSSSKESDDTLTETVDAWETLDENTTENAVSQEELGEEVPEEAIPEGNPPNEEMLGEDIPKEDLSNEDSHDESSVGKDVSEEELPDGENEDAVPSDREDYLSGWERRQYAWEMRQFIKENPSIAYYLPTPSPTPEKQEGLFSGYEFAEGLLFGACASVLLFALINKLVSGAKKRGKGLHMDGIVIQGLGGRETQQDTIYLSDTKQYPKQGLLMVVADGMGGLQNGGFLSRAAASAAASTFAKSPKTDPERLVVTMVQNATNAVNVLLSPNYGAGGTTLIVAMIYMGKLYFSSVGDSRLCLYRNGDLILLNRTHVFEEELLLRTINGDMSYDAARTYEKKGALTSYLGMGPLKYFDFPMYHIPLKKGDRIIAMSDGIFNTLSDEEIGAAIRKKPEKAAEELTDKVEKKQQRYQDNYSAVLIAVE